MTLSLGLAGALGPDLIAELAPAVEAAGFTALWVNDTPDGDAIAALAAAAAVTERLTLATGVIPVDRRPGTEIADAVRASGVPQDRLVLGIGSGTSARGSLARVDEAVAHLRETLASRVVVGALGPRMRRLGMERADGVLLNWVTPDEAARQSSDLHAAASTGHVALYVRTAVDPAAFDALRTETARYARFPNYAANFERMGVAAAATVLEGEDAVRERLPAYLDAVDELVLRAVTAEQTVAAYRAFIDRTAPTS